MTSNEFRQVIGLKPSKDSKADQLINSNLNHAEDKFKQASSLTKETNEGGKSQNG